MFRYMHTRRSERGTGKLGQQQEVTAPTTEAARPLSDYTVWHASLAGSTGKIFAENNQPSLGNDLASALVTQGVKPAEQPFADAA